jgi:mono/diheme cytochrome c family protein
MTSIRWFAALAPLLVAGLGGCNVPTPLAPAEPIGTFPTWGEDFNTPKEQPASLLANPKGSPHEGGTGGTDTSSTGAAMPGALKSFAGGDVTVGKGVYLALCARCHGAAGEGGGLPGGVAVPALSDAKFQASLTDSQMARSIALGKGAMPSFMNDLDRDKLAAVIAYSRTLKK